MENPQSTLQYLEQQLDSIGLRIYSFVRERPWKVLGYGLAATGGSMMISSLGAEALAETFHYATNVALLNNIHNFGYAGLIITGAGSTILAIERHLDLKRTVRERAEKERKMENKLRELGYQV